MRLYYIFLTIILMSCAKIECVSPLIQLGDSCCLDSNSNNICDDQEVKPSDEILESPEIIVEPKESVVEIIEEEKIILFNIYVEDVKNKIRMLDQAIVILEVENLANVTTQYTVTLPNKDWTLTSNQLIYPITLFSLPDKSNKIQLAIQPDKNKIESGMHEVLLNVSDNYNYKEISVQIEIE